MLLKEGSDLGPICGRETVVVEQVKRRVPGVELDCVLDDVLP